MPVTDFSHSAETLSLTITAEFAAPVDRVWRIYTDPRQLEKIWGPPTFPATFPAYDFRPGGRATYYMTSPEGERFGGWWEFIAIDDEATFTFRDGFADGDGNPLDDMPVSSNSYSFTATDSGTRAVYRSVYETSEHLQMVLDMGVQEGATTAINQIDELLAAETA